MSGLKYGVAVQAACIPSLTTMDGTPSLQCGRANALSKMSRTKKYVHLRTKGSGDVEGASVHEKKTVDERKVE